jgi:hypothetical protein
MSAPTLPLCFLRNWRSGVLEKMRSLINTNGQQSDTRRLLEQSRRTSDAQIEHQTESLQDEKDLTLKGLLRKCVGNSMRPHVALQKSARREMPTPGGALSENQKPSPKIATSDLLRLRPRAIRGLVKALTSIFRPRISNYSAALNAAQR